MPKKKVYDSLATQEFFNQANEAVRQKQHFTLETNFRDKELVNIVAQFKRRGYTTNMVYLTLDSIEQSIYRVNKRVLNGGHFVDHKNIRLNYDEGLLYLERYADSFDNLEIVDSSKDFSEFKSLLSIKQQELIYLNTNLPDNPYRDKRLSISPTAIGIIPGMKTIMKNKAGIIAPAGSATLSGKAIGFTHFR